MYIFGKPMEEMSFKELAEALEGTQAGSQAFDKAIGEIHRRGAIAQIDAAKAEQAAAESQKRAADAQIRTANWTIGAVVVASLAVIVTAVGIWIEYIGRG